MGQGGQALIIYTGGTFDTFHRGHENLLRQCRLLAGPNGKVIVSLNSDEFVEEFKGRPPVDTYELRRLKVLACRHVSSVILNGGGADSRPAIMSVKPNVIAIGTDWATQDYYKQMSFTQEWLNAEGIVLVYLPRLEGISSSQMRGPEPWEVEPQTGPDPEVDE